MIGVQLRTGNRINILVTAMSAIGILACPPSDRRMQARQVADIGHQEAEPGYADGTELDLPTATDKLIEAHNRIRKTEKLSTLSSSKKLTAAAEVQAEDMAKNSRMSHEGSDGSKLVDRVRAQEYEYRRIGENVAFGRFTIDQVMDGWMKSEVHRKNILGGYSQIGAAIALDKGGVPYWCVTFGLPRRK